MKTAGLNPAARKTHLRPRSRTLRRKPRASSSCSCPAACRTSIASTPKPKLTTDHGKQVTFDHPETRNRPGYEKLFLKKPNWKFKKRGKCGTEVSELFPHVAGCADDLAVIRS